MACNCIASNVVIPPPTLSCPDCLRAGSAIIACASSVGPCGSGQLSVSTIGDYSACTCDVSYSIVEFDDDFDTATIDADGVISFTLSENAVPNTFPEIRFLVSCDCSIYSSIGSLKVCVQNLCSGVVCGVDEQCNPCTGLCEPIPPIVNAGVD